MLCAIPSDDIYGISEDLVEGAAAALLEEEGLFGNIDLDDGVQDLKADTGEDIVEKIDKGRAATAIATGAVDLESVMGSAAADAAFDFSAAVEATLNSTKVHGTQSYERGSYFLMQP